MLADKEKQEIEEVAIKCEISLLATRLSDAVYLIHMKQWKN